MQAEGARTERQSPRAIGVPLVSYLPADAYRFANLFPRGSEVLGELDVSALKRLGRLDNPLVVADGGGFGGVHLVVGNFGREVSELLFNVHVSRIFDECSSCQQIATLHGGAHDY